MFTQKQSGLKARKMLPFSSKLTQQMQCAFSDHMTPRDAVSSVRKYHQRRKKSLFGKMTFPL